MAVTDKQVWEVLKGVKDPEIHMSIVDLGLVYGVTLAEQPDGKAKVNVKMTLTGPGCPYGPAILSKAHADVSQIPEVADVSVDLVWIPQWDPRKMASDEAKMQLGIFELEDEEGNEDDLKPGQSQKSS